MKKWEKAEINCVAISSTEQKVSLDLVYDGGYIGDGKFGWFGGSESSDCGGNDDDNNQGGSTEFDS